MSSLRKQRDMTKLKPNIKPTPNIHIMRDSQRAKEHLVRLTQLIDASYTSLDCEVEVILKKTLIMKEYEV